MPGPADFDQQGVSATDNQGNIWFDRKIAREKWRKQMTLEMVDREIRLAETKREPFCDGSTNHERTSQTGARCRCKRVYFMQADSRFLHRALQKARRLQKMITRRYLR